MISISLMGQGWDPVIPPKVLPAEPSLINYIKIWEGTSSLVSHGFSLYLKNTLIYAVGATAVVLLVDSLAGYAFARLEFAGRDIAFGAILATLMISPMVLFIPVYLLFSEFGLINTYIGIILPHTISGFGVFLMRQFIKTLPSSIEDAALIDGCSKFGVYWRIVLPMMKPALATLGIITFIVTWNSFLWPLILARDSSLYSLTVALGYFQAQGNTLWSQLMAATTFTMLPVVIIFVSLQKHYVRGFVISGTKG
jgi:ABC-type glycerol-3-phosphate transport system permease component